MGGHSNGQLSYFERSNGHSRLELPVRVAPRVMAGQAEAQQVSGSRVARSGLASRELLAAQAFLASFVSLTRTTLASAILRTASETYRPVTALRATIACAAAF